MNEVIPLRTSFINCCIHFNKLGILKLHTFVALRVEHTKEEIIFGLLFKKTH